MKRIITLILAVFMLLYLAACGVDEPGETTPSAPVELWVVTEETVWDGMNALAKTLIKQFELENENVFVKLDVLPTNKEERAVYLERLRAEIMAGAGPDAYLLPTSDLLELDSPEMTIQVEHLFEDVSLSMRNGVFYDISEYYDADDELGKEALITEVMDAGKIGEARYVLPLRFDMPVICVDTEKLNASDLDPSDLEADYSTFLSAVTATGDSHWISGSEYRSGYSFFTDCIDYEKGEVTLTADELARHLKNEVTVRFAMGLPLTKVMIYDYIQLNTAPERADYPMQVADLFLAMGYAAIEKSLDRDLTMVPLRNPDGLVTATITYYAAVGASCDDPESAYEFLRLFLLEESQWERNRPKKKGSRVVDQTYGLIEDGWPVRAAGSVDPLWRMHRSQNKNVYDEKAGQATRKKQVTSVLLTDDDIPVLSVKIDQVSFPLSVYDRNLTSSRTDIKKNWGTYTDEDILQIAQDLIQDLQWHLAEG